MFNKISITAIVKDHVSTLRNSRTGRLHYPDVFLFIILPAIVSILLVHLGIHLNDPLVNALITSFSIFSALLFNLLLLVYDISGKEAVSAATISDPVEKKKAVRRRSLLREIYINVSFSILVSTMAVALLLGYFLKIDMCAFLNVDACPIGWLLPCIIYYFSVQFLLTLFMVLRRVYVLLAQSFES